jgi:hypothetical protein
MNLDYCDIHNTYYCVCKDKFCNNILSTKYLDVYGASSLSKINNRIKLNFSSFKILFKIPQQLNPINPLYFYAHNLSLIIEPLYVYSKFPTDIILLIGDYLYYTPNNIKNTSIKNIINKQTLITNGYYNTNPNIKNKPQNNLNICDRSVFKNSEAELTPNGVFKNESENRREPGKFFINYSCSYKKININKKIKLNKNKYFYKNESETLREPGGFFKNATRRNSTGIFKKENTKRVYNKYPFKKLNVPIKINKFRNIYVDSISDIYDEPSYSHDYCCDCKFCDYDNYM